MSRNMKVPGLAGPSPKFLRILTPFQDFLHNQNAGGILLFICTLLALAWANSPYSSSYFTLWNTKVTAGAGSFILSKPLLLWINDGLMAVFFFVVGLEIKRETTVGELASIRRASLPVFAAAGGMLVPALLYTFFNFRGEGAHGWGIPMATDIAFSLGVLQLLGRRVPLSLKIFLTAFAIVDDIGAVLVIAVFYTAKISLPALAVGAVALALAVFFNASGVRRPIVYVLVGLVMWVAVLKSGVHATVAGVLLAMAIPGRTRIAEREFLENGRSILKDFERAGPLDVQVGLNQKRQSLVNTLEEMSEGVQTPLQRFEESLHPYVAFLILPLFALANAGVKVGSSVASALLHPVALGIMVGLVAGKLVGVLFFSWLAVKLKIALLPARVTWMHVLGVSMLGGIGFTMSLFVANLAFGTSILLDYAKVGILTGSLISGVLGTLILLMLVPAPQKSRQSSETIAHQEELGETEDEQ